MQDAIDDRAEILEKLFEQYHLWRSLLEEQGIEILKVKGFEFDFLDVMRHVDRLPKEQQKAVEYLRLGIEDKELKKLGLGISSEVSLARKTALKQLAQWSLDEES